MIKISVIIPAYNVEKYIKQCISSVINQTLKEIEIIVINDGSTDLTLERINEIKDKRIRIITKRNEGLSSARNVGIEIAKGKYIIFLDSDDFIIHKDSLENMYNLIDSNNMDMLSGNAMYFYDDSNEYKDIGKNFILNKNEIISIDEYIMRTKNCDIAPACFYLYKKEFIIDNNLFFKKGIYHEDELFTYKCLLKCKSIAICSEKFYAYRQREGSIMNSKINPKKGKDIIQVCLDLEEVFADIKNKEVKKFLYQRSFNIILENICKYELYDKNKDINLYLLKYSYKFKSKIRSILYIVSPKIYVKFIKVLGG
ncbi:glycosyltransferase family 2 protein [Romboutsia timonensis]|uniref:glycosyltransferase family 2 protein n=1 Tax=Romboutsia timonensis TaxID=1776391 RepID=UPI002A811B0B|nr:glycosyltransferase [Romboutsia timonensis]MDY3959367.1 glycosyltransferase [Romboutsia timonensis]